MMQEDRRTLLLLDNASAHHVEEPLSNVEIQMLPPNTTSILQLQDAGVVASLKAWFKRRQVQYAVEKADEILGAAGIVSSTDGFYNVDVLQAMRRCQEAWESVSLTTTANCWRHTGILPEGIYDLSSGIANVRLNTMSPHSLQK